MLLDRRNGSSHLPWIVFVVAVTVGAAAWFFSAGRGAELWPGGSSLPGLTFGVAGGVLILFEFLLCWRKKVRTWRIGRTQIWMQAHIWLGLLTVPLLVLHSGLRWGGTLSTVLMALFLIVIASGVWGLILQQWIPRRMLDMVPAETIHSQIDRVVQQFIEDAARLVHATCGPADDESLTFEEIELAATERAESFLTVGAVRSVGKVQGRVLQTQVPHTPVAEAKPLREFFRSTVAPFLQQGTGSKSPLRFPNRAASMFADLRTKLPPEAHDALAALEGLCDQRRQLDQQARLHVWLHNWLLIHLPLSVALVLLMFVHIVVAMKYR